MGGLIVVSGIDGSGKSSQLAWIAASLAAQHQSYTYLRLRWAALTAVPLLASARLLGYTSRRYNPRSQSVVVEQRYHEFPAMRALWPPLFAFDMTVKAWWQMLKPLRRGDWVICDRFALDAIVDVAAALRDERLLEGRFAASLLRLMPRDARTLVIDMDPMTAYRRKLDVLDPAYLEIRRPMFLRMADRLNIPVVDGNRDFEDIQQDVAEIIGVEPLLEHRGVLIKGLS